MPFLSLHTLRSSKRFLFLYNFSEHLVHPVVLPKYYSVQNLENEYSDCEKEKILEVINNLDNDVLSRYDITKTKSKKFSQWKNRNGSIKSITEIESVNGFSVETVRKLFNSILEGPKNKEKKLSSKIKGQILYPNLNETICKNCRTVLALYVSVNCVCWTLIDKSNYEVTEWKYHTIDYPEGKKFQITDILNIAWHITQRLPHADIYVMKAEATTLRAAGSDPNNPKMISVNLQKAQMIAMMVALINTRSNYLRESDPNDVDSVSKQEFDHKVYFLRPSLPYRLYGTLIGNERVSTDQTVEMILQNVHEVSPNNSQVYVSDKLKSMFRSQKELQKDMLGHCLLLGLTFMDLCIYRNQESINRLTKRGE